MSAFFFFFKHPKCFSTRFLRVFPTHMQVCSSEVIQVFEMPLSADIWCSTSVVSSLNYSSLFNFQPPRQSQSLFSDTPSQKDCALLLEFQLPNCLQIRQCSQEESYIKVILPNMVFFKDCILFNFYLFFSILCCLQAKFSLQFIIFIHGKIYMKQSVSIARNGSPQDLLLFTVYFNNSVSLLLVFNSVLNCAIFVRVCAFFFFFSLFRCSTQLNLKWHSILN